MWKSDAHNLATKHTWPNQQADSAKTYVACRDARVVGYYALAAGSVRKRPERIAKGLANHPIGVVLLARLAVDDGERSQGLGKALSKQARNVIARRRVLLVGRASACGGLQPA